MLSEDKNIDESIKYTLGRDVNTSLSEFFDQDCDYKLGKKYVGKIVDNKDPERMGRCKVRVFGAFGPEIQDKDLPWAMPDFGFIGSLRGSFIIPPNGCIVSVYFERGEIYLPRYTRKIMNSDKLPKNKDKDYPDNMIFFETDNGDRFEINRKKKETLFEHASGSKVYVDNIKIEVEHNTGTKLTMDKQKFEVEHKSGSKITMDALGNITITQNSTGTISLGNGAIIPCPDLPTCLITGAPLAINTIIPGKSVLVP